MIKVIVTQEDIRNGVIGRMGLCPIARALKRATGNPSYYMGCNYIHYWNKGIHRRVYGTEKVRRFRERFDNGLVVKPFSFRFDPDALKAVE